MYLQLYHLYQSLYSYPSPIINYIIIQKKEQEKTEEKEENNKEEKVEVEKLTIDSQIVKELFEIFREDKNCMMAGLWGLYSELDAKKYIAYSQLEESDFEMDGYDENLLTNPAHKVIYQNL